MYVNCVYSGIKSWLLPLREPIAMVLPKTGYLVRLSLTNQLTEITFNQWPIHPGKIFTSETYAVHTVQTFNSYNSQPFVCKNLVVQTHMSKRASTTMTQ